jgi:hypothetical protein
MRHVVSEWAGLTKVPDALTATAIDCLEMLEIGVRVTAISSDNDDKGRICLYMKLCDLILLSMILQLELRVNKDH